MSDSVTFGAPGGHVQFTHFPNAELRILGTDADDSADDDPSDARASEAGPGTASLTVLAAMGVGCALSDLLAVATTDAADARNVICTIRTVRESQ